MTTIKSYTDIEESKALAKILPLKSADMRYYEYTSHIDGTPKVGYVKGITGGIPCWSLTALLGVLPNNEHVKTSVSRGGWQIEPINYLPNTWWCEYEDSESLTEFNVSAENPIDACVAMIEKLHKLNLL